MAQISQMKILREDTQESWIKVPGGMGPYQGKDCRPRVCGQMFRLVLRCRMAYQPNDFVNPYQRGVELPAGCKDLNEALEKVSGQGRMPRRVFPTKSGTVKDIPRYVQAVFMEGWG